MFCPEKNSYLQLVCAMEPRVINKAVDRAMSKKVVDGPTVANYVSPIQCICAEYVNLPEEIQGDPIPARGLASAQPSCYAPHVDVTRARLGFGRVGLRVLNRQLHDEDPLTQLQAIHTVLDQPSSALHVDVTRARLGYSRVGLLVLNRQLHDEDPLTQLQPMHTVLDQVRISENALYLINLNVIHRLTDLLDQRNPVIREKICLTLTHLAGYYQGRQRLGACPGLIFRLMCIFMRDKPEIRYAAAYTLRVLSKDRCACEKICKVDGIIENLLTSIKKEYTGIVLIHLKTLNNLFEWDPVEPLKQNAFLIMLKLFSNEDPKIVAAAMECMSQLCKHDVGKLLADEHDLTFVLRPFLHQNNYEIVIAAVGLMCYTTLTKRSKWRAKEACLDLTKTLTYLCHAPCLPILQLKVLQVLINLCDCPDIRNFMKMYWERKIQLVMIRPNEEWDGTSETTSMGLETGHNYRTMCIEGVETIKNDYGDNAEVVNVHSYLQRLREKKRQLLEAINRTPYS